MKKNCIYAVLILIICLGALKSFGAEHHVFHLDHRDGLSSNYVRCIGEDGHGFIWVGTDNGLDRFDGSSFKHFTKENSGLSSNEINSVMVEPGNPDVLWVSTRHDGLSRYDYTTGLFEKVRDGLQTPDVPCLAPSSDGKIWVTHYHGLPEKLDPKTLKVEKLFNKVPDGFLIPVWCAVEAPEEGTLYVGHVDGGMSRIDLQYKTVENFRYNPDQPGIGGNCVYKIMIDSSGLVWIGTENGVSVFDPAIREFRNLTHDSSPGSLLKGSVHDIKEMSNGDIWIGTTEGGVSVLKKSHKNKGIYVFENHIPTFSLFPDSSITSADIRSFCEDSYGNIWIGNYNDGLDIKSYDSPFFISEVPFLRESGKVSHPAVWSVTTDSSGNIWIGGENKVMRMKNGDTRLYYLPLSAPNAHVLVKALKEGADGSIWVGTNNAGVYVLSPHSGSFTKVTFAEKEVHDFLALPDGSMLIATFSGIYSSHDGKTASALGHINSQLYDRLVLAMVRDNAGQLWVGTLGQGITVFSRGGKRLKHYLAENGLPSNSVNAMHIDSTNNIWIATRDGAMRINLNDPEDVSTLMIRDGLSNSNVKSIISDSYGNIWMSTNRDIVKYNPENDSVSVYTHTYTEPLTAFTEKAVTTTPGGDIYLGSLNGLVHFNANRQYETASMVPPLLTSLVAFDGKDSDKSVEINVMSEGGKIELPYNYNTFTLKFDIPDITQSANSDFSYFMEGVSNDWAKADDSNSVFFRNLKPGTYKFMVRTRLNGREWSSPLTLAEVVITPPTYLTWWAKTLYVVLSIGILLFAFFFYKHKLNLEKKLEIAQENSKNNRLLNEERLIFYTNVTHELRTPLSLIIGPLEDLVNDQNLNPDQRKKLLTMRTSAMRLLNLINGILEFRKTETQNRKLQVERGNMGNLVREIGLRFKELNNNPEVAVVIDVNVPDAFEMYYDPEMITIILNNLLGNAMKYTRRGLVTLSFSITESKGVRYACITVKDTGEGIAKDEIPLIFKRYYQGAHNRKVSGTGIGLSLTKNLVEIHQGTITVDSTLGKGSCFKVTLLADCCYPEAVHKEVETDAEQRQELDAGQEDDNGRLVVLVVEDDNDVSDYISSALGNEFTVLTASNGKEGLDAAAAHMPDIIVSDVMMPVMDGMEMCRALKSDFATSHIPVILLTAKDTLADKEEGYESGADSYITKPFSATLLRSRILNIIEARHKFALRIFAKNSDAEENISTTDASGAVAPGAMQRMMGNAAPELGRLDLDFMNKFCALVEENLQVQDLDINFLTEQMCMSHSTLYRKMKGITGLSPNEFIRTIKIRKAADLVAEDRYTLNEIAQLTGFNNQAYFRRVFKKEFGVSPSEFKPK